MKTINRSVCITRLSSLNRYRIYDMRLKTYVCNPNTTTKTMLSQSPLSVTSHFYSPGEEKP